VKTARLALAAEAVVVVAADAIATAASVAIKPGSIFILIPAAMFGGGFQFGRPHLVSLCGHFFVDGAAALAAIRRSADTVKYILDR
jgi:hypothetical protein